MYIPIMKTRAEELKVAEKFNSNFSDEVIPLFEVLNEFYDTKYETDENGKYLMELKAGKKKKSKIEIPHVSEDIITLKRINDIVNHSNIFIDYFRFDIKKYGANIDIKSVELSYMLNNNDNEYIKKMKEISKYKNMIPVLSLKDPFSFTNSKVKEIIEDLKLLNLSIAVRIEDGLYDLYKNTIEECLGSTDYLLYDIGEQNFDSKIMELMELRDGRTKAKKVLLNSPRRKKIGNKEYENEAETILVDNVAAVDYSKYGFIGFGDYGGLKDQLPTNDNPNGMGAALALLYNYDRNCFYSFCNSNTSLGLSGYHFLIEEILEYKGILDKSNNCLAYCMIQELYDRSGTGNWGTWNNITLTRYINQMCQITNINKKRIV